MSLLLLVVPFPSSQVCVFTALSFPRVTWRGRSPPHGLTAERGPHFWVVHSCFWCPVTLQRNPVTRHVDAFEPTFLPGVLLSKIHFGDIWVCCLNIYVQETAECLLSGVLRGTELGKQAVCLIYRTIHFGQSFSLGSRSWTEKLVHQPPFPRHQK